MDIKKLLAEWISKSREISALSLEELGARVAIEIGSERGATRANVSHWEKGRSQPSLLQILAIAKITKCKLPSDLLEYITEPEIGENEIHGTRTENISTLNWNTLDEVELLSEYRQATSEGRRLVRDLLKNVEKEKKYLRAVS